MLSIGNEYHDIFGKSIDNFNSEKHKEEDFIVFVQKEEKIITNLKNIIIRRKAPNT